MREFLLEGCVCEVKWVSSFYRQVWRLYLLRNVWSTPQLPSGEDLEHPCQTPHPMVERRVRPNQGPAQPAHNLASGLLDFSSPQTCEFWPNWLCHFWVLGPFIHKFDSRHRPIDLSSDLISILLHLMVILYKRLVNLILVEYYYTNMDMHCKYN